MPQYDNPAAFLPDPNNFTTGGLPNVMSGMMAVQRQQQAAPFLDELLKQQQMSTQHQGADLQEYLSPQGVATRQAERQKIIDEGDVYHQTKDSKVLQEKEAARLKPYMTDAQIEEAKVHAQQSKHLFASEPVKYFSGAFNILKDMPEEQRAPVYNKLVQTSGYPTDRLDPELQTYGPTTMGHLAAARYAQVHTPEQEQKETLTSIPAEAGKETARINVRGRMAELAQQIKAGRFDNDQRMVASIEKSLRTGKDADSGETIDEAQKAELQTQLRRYKSAKLLDFVTKQTEMERMARMIGTMSGDPVKAAAANKAYDQATDAAREQGMKVMGLTNDDLGVQKKQTFKVGDSLTVGTQKYPIVQVNADGSYMVKVGNTLKKVVPK